MQEFLYVDSTYRHPGVYNEEGTLCGKRFMTFTNKPADQCTGSDALGQKVNEGNLKGVRIRWPTGLHPKEELDLFWEPIYETSGDPEVDAALIVGGGSGTPADLVFHQVPDLAPTPKVIRFRCNCCQGGFPQSKDVIKIGNTTPFRSGTPNWERGFNPGLHGNKKVIWDHGFQDTPGMVVAAMQSQAEHFICQGCFKEEFVFANSDGVNTEVTGHWPGSDVTTNNWKKLSARSFNLANARSTAHLKFELITVDKHGKQTTRSLGELKFLYDNAWKDGNVNQRTIDKARAIIESIDPGLGTMVVACQAWISCITKGGMHVSFACWAGKHGPASQSKWFGLGTGAVTSTTEDIYESYKIRAWLCIFC